MNRRATRLSLSRSAVYRTILAVAFVAMVGCASDCGCRSQSAPTLPEVGASSLAPLDVGLADSPSTLIANQGDESDDVPERGEGQGTQVGAIDPMTPGVGDDVAPWQPSPEEMIHVGGRRGPDGQPIELGVIELPSVATPRLTDPRLLQRSLPPARAVNVRPHEAPE